MRVLVDGRVDGTDGIGRYTRSVVVRLCDSNPADIEVTVLRPGTARRYSRAEGKELLFCAADCRADLVRTLDYRVPVTVTAEIDTIVTVHDVLRVLRPDLCYSDAEFATRFGEEGLVDLREVVADLREVAAFPIRRAPASMHEEYLGRTLALAVSRADCVITPTVTVARQLCDIVPARDKLCVSPWGVDHLPTATGPLPAGIPDYGPAGASRGGGFCPRRWKLSQPACRDSYEMTTSTRTPISTVLSDTGKQTATDGVLCQGQAAT